MKTRFCTFADKRNLQSLKRIKRQAEQIRLFDQILAFDEGELDSEFCTKYHHVLRTEVRGFGYWVWKPQVIKQTLAAADYGDIILYTDAGCHLRVEGKDRLIDYFKTLAESPKFIMACDIGTKFPEKNWTKGDLFEYFACHDDPAITESSQIQSCVIFIKKTLEAEEFINDWSRVFEFNFSLVDDSPSQKPNFEGFVEHRHDQSIFSLMCKRSGVHLISNNEIYRPQNWSDLDAYPIWAMRDLVTKTSKLQRINRRIKKIVSLILNHT